jgi:hypothetical protein
MRCHFVTQYTHAIAQPLLSPPPQHTQTHLPVLQASCAGSPRPQPSKVRVVQPDTRQVRAMRPKAHTLSTHVLQGRREDSGGSTTASTAAADSSNRQPQQHTQSQQQCVRQHTTSVLVVLCRVCPEEQWCTFCYTSLYTIHCTQCTSKHTLS